MKIINYINKNLNIIMVRFFLLILGLSTIMGYTSTIIASGVILLYYKIEILQESLKEKPKVNNVTVTNKSITETLIKDGSRGICSSIGCNRSTVHKVLEKETGKFLWVCLKHALEVNEKILLEGKK